MRREWKSLADRVDAEIYTYISTMQETAKEQESLVVKNQRAEEYSSSKKNISHVIEGRKGQPWKGELKARKMVSQREARNTWNRKVRFLVTGKLKEKGGWVKILQHERKSIKDHGSKKAICWKGVIALHPVVISHGMFRVKLPQCFSFFFVQCYWLLYILLFHPSYGCALCHS